MRNIYININVKYRLSWFFCKNQLTIISTDYLLLCQCLTLNEFEIQIGQSNIYKMFRL